MIRVKPARLAAAMSLALLVHGMVSCRRPSSAATAVDPIEKYRLNESFVRRDVVADAVDACDCVLGNVQDVVLRASWEQSPARGVPVYLIDSDSLGPNELCFIPNGERCVLISSALFDNLGRLFYENDPAEVDRQARDVLSIMLLHECGHLHFGDSGSFGAASTDLNLEMNETKEREMRADRFAAECLRSASDDGTGAFGNRRVTAMVLKSQVILLNFNFFGHRITIPGAREFRDKDVYWDNSLTHPNLDFRMLNIAADMDPDDDSAQKNLRDFLDARDPYPQFRLFPADQSPPSQFHLLGPQKTLR